MQRLAAAKEKEMVRKAKASAGIPPFGEKKQETLIELQNSRYSNDAKLQQQEQLQEQMNLRMLEEQEASIRQLEVFLFFVTNQIHILIIFANVIVFFLL